MAVMIVASVLVGLGGAGPAAAVADHPAVQVGFVCSCTGSPEASSTALAKPGFQAWVRYTNAHGGVAGRKIHVTYVDDAFNPGASLAEVERLVSQDHVAAIVDSSYVDSAWSTYAQQHRVPVIGDITDQLFLTNSDFFADGETLDAYFTTFVLAAKKVGAKRISQFYCAEAAACQQGVAPFEATAKKLGVAVPYVTQVSASAPNYTAQCLTAKQAGVQAIVIADAITVVEHVMADCAAQNYHPWAIALGGAVSAAYPTSPGLGSRFIGAEPDIPFFVHTTRATKTYVAALKRYAPGTLTNPNYGETVTQSWVSGELLGAAIKAADVKSSGSFTARDVLQGLHKLHATTLGGMAPPLTYKVGNPNPVDCWYWVQTKNGHWVSSSVSRQATCAKPVKVS